MPLLVILGRQPSISLAELETVLGPDPISLIQPAIARLDTSSLPVPFDHLGGSVKAAKILTKVDTQDWNKIISQIIKLLPEQLESTGDGKITFGLSVYGLRANLRQINASALEMKKTIKNLGRSVRVVPNSEPELNAAKVLHNKLAGQNGIELILVASGNSTYVARTVWIQDIEAYARRDRERPKRDARVGMLPPKLAQTIINLSGFKPKMTLLDPFCGTGVILQETLLMGGHAIGSDLEPRMIEYSAENLKWLGYANVELAVADATSHSWDTAFDTIGCETYLGRALTSLPDLNVLEKIISDVNTIHIKFLKNIARQTPTGFRMCIAVPAWKLYRGFRHLPALDHLRELGYNRVSFVHVDTKDLIYHRSDQTVARELVILERS